MRSRLTQHWSKVSYLCSHPRRQRTTLSRREEPRSPPHEVNCNSNEKNRNSRSGGWATCFATCAAPLVPKVGMSEAIVKGRTSLRQFPDYSKPEVIGSPDGVSGKLACAH